MTKIIYNFVIHFINLFKNSRKICSNCIITRNYVRRNYEPILLFNCLPLSILLYYIYRDLSIHMHRYASVNEKYVFYDRTRKLHLFTSKLKSVEIKLNLVIFSLQIWVKINRIYQSPIKVFQSKLKYAITKFKFFNPFLPIGPRWDRLANISILI